MGKKKISQLNQPSGPIQTSSTTPSIAFDQQNTLQLMLSSTNHTHRIDALNTITSLLKPHNVTSMGQNGLFETISLLMTDKMMTVGLAATAVFRHVVQICDSQFLVLLVAKNLHHSCYTLLQHLSPLYQSFLAQTVISKGHGLYWYNPSYLNLFRMLNHITKILSSLFEVSQTLPSEFNTLLTQADHFAQQLQQQQPLPQPHPINFLHFFFQILSLNIATVPPHLIAAVHLPFITQLHIDILHLLRVLCHENLPMTQRFLSEPTIIAYLLQQPQHFLLLQQQTTTSISYSPPPPVLPTQSSQPLPPSTIIQCNSDSIYTYQYCQSVVLSNLHNEYHKLTSSNKKNGALATSFTIHSIPHTNIEFAMSIVVIIANMIEQINVQPTNFITNDQQKSTIESLYQTVLVIIQYAIQNIDMNQELAIYLSSLQSLRSHLVSISTGNLSLLEQYNLEALSQTEQQQISRTQFKTLNVNNTSNPQQQQQFLIQSLQQLSTTNTTANSELDNMAQASESMIGMNPQEPIDESQQSSTNGDNDATTPDEFPLDQLWNDAIQFHTSILQQYFNVKTLVSDCFTMLFSDHVYEDDESIPTKKRSKQPLPQMTIFHNFMSQMLQSSILMPLLNHSFAHIHSIQTISGSSSYYPLPLVVHIHNLYNSNTNDYPIHIASLSYQNTLLRVNSLTNVLYLLQYSQLHAPQHTLFTNNVQQLHTILLTILSSTSLSRTLQAQQKSLHTLEEHFVALSSLELSIAGDIQLSAQNTQDGLNRISTLLNSTTIDEASLILQNLTTFVSNQMICDYNRKLWDSPVLESLKEQISPIPTPSHSTESFTQTKIDQILSHPTIANANQLQHHLYVPESFANAVNCFIGYMVTVQQLYQSTTSGPISVAQHKINFQSSPHIEFQHLAMDYISLMAINYPLFSPLMPLISTYFTSLISLFILLKSAQFNCNLLFQFVNLVIDVFSEDDRLLLSYTTNKITTALISFHKVYSEYLSWIKRMKLELQPKLTKGVKKATQTVSLTPQKQRQLIELEESLEMTKEAHDILGDFIQHKKKFKL